MNMTKKGPVIDPGLCRCCGNMKKCRILNVEYDFCGQKEVYSDMFFDCFSLVLSHLEGEEGDRLICATCVTRLRDAVTFRRQVLHNEEKLLQAQMQIEDASSNKHCKNHVDIKIETCDEPDDSGDDNIDIDALDAAMETIDDTEIITKEKCNKRPRAKRKSLSEENLLTETEILAKINEMSEKLKEQQYGDQLPVPPRLAKWMSTKSKAFHNLVTLVENSYVCPFSTSFGNLSCIYCKEICSDANHLTEHVMNHHDPRLYKDTVIYRIDLQIDISRIDCRLCPVKIDTLELFYKHITSVHNKKLYPTIRNEFLRFNLKLPTITCLECGNTYQNYQPLKKHMAEHYGTCICDICGGHFFDEHKLSVHQRIHIRKKNNIMYPCKECGRKFKSRHGMQYHVSKAHSSEPTFQCQKCDEIFFSLTLRSRHMIEVHGQLAKKYHCKSCDRVYDSKKSLREHHRKNHLKLLKHQCDICDRKFYLPSALKDHMTSHTGERNFRCEYCGKSYPRLRALRVHMQTHDSEKRYKCTLCTASYTQSTNLKTHLRNKHHTAEYLEDLQ